MYDFPLMLIAPRPSLMRRWMGYRSPAPVNPQFRRSGLRRGEIRERHCGGTAMIPRDDQPPALRLLDRCSSGNCDNLKIALGLIIGLPRDAKGGQRCGVYSQSLPAL